MSYGPRIQDRYSRVGETLLMKFGDSWQSAECVDFHGETAVWETADGKRGTMTARLWDLNRARQRIEGEGGGA